MNLATYLETAGILADAARDVVRASWQADGTTAFKDDGSPVTRTDIEVEERLRDILAVRHPDHGILGEEYGHDRRSGAFTWVIDPIDGTRQFAARLMNFGVLIALCVDAVPVLGVIDQPLAGLRCVGAKGHGTSLNGKRVRSRQGSTLDDAVISLANPRSFESAGRQVFDALSQRGAMVVYDGGCIAYMALASGAVDVCLNGADLDPYDICALVPIVEEAGGRISTWDGKAPTMETSGAIFASGSVPLHRETNGIIRRALTARPGAT